MLIVSGSDINHINLVIRQERIEGTVKLRDSGLGREAFSSLRAAAIHGGNFRVGLGIDGIDHPALSNVTGADDAPELAAYQIRRRQRRQDRFPRW